MSKKQKEEEEIKPFKIEKDIVPQKAGRVAIFPKDYFRIKATMQIMDIKDSFLFPINGYKASSVVGWVTRIEKEWADEILDLELREKTKKTFYKSVIKDSNKKPTGVRIYRLS